MEFSGKIIKAFKRLIHLLWRYCLRILFSFFDVTFIIYYLLPGNKSLKILHKILKSVRHVPLVGTIINWWITHYFATAADPRPRPFSLWSATENKSAYPSPLPDPMTSLPPTPSYGPVSDYTSWNSLTNKKFSSRHLPPSPDESKASIDEVARLFQRPSDNDTDLDRSSLLFAFFAQWFTDSFMRVDANDRRKNTSTHDIDLCPIYGLDEEACDILRTKIKHEKHKKHAGKLRSQSIDGEEFPEYLGRMVKGQWKVQRKFRKLYYAERIDQILGSFANNMSRKQKLYATGLERGNSSIGYVAISTLFLREHNRICDLLVGEYGNPTHPDYEQWNRDPVYFDERVFQTARMINTVILLKLVVEEYINHIAGANAFKLDPGFAEELSWYRTNWITIEFDLLYRWHSLAVEEIQINNVSYGTKDYRFNNGALETLGLKTVIEAVSSQKAGRIGLKNTPAFLWNAEVFALKMAREFKVQPYNAYREKFGLSKLNSIEELVGTRERDRPLIDQLKKLYQNDIDKVEYLVGIFAEQREQPALFGELMHNMVAFDAFTHIYTNPLLSRNVFNEATFTPLGMKIIEETKSLRQFVSRNCKDMDVAASFGA